MRSRRSSKSNLLIDDPSQRLNHFPMDSRIETLQTDITTLQIDVIVNAANSSLLGGGGVDGAIHHAAGPELVQECRMLHGCKTGEAKITKAYKLPAKHVIHTVGPVYNGGRGNEAELLANCYDNSLKLAVEHNLRSIAFPGISTGIFGYPKQDACDIALTTTNEFLSKNESLERVIMVCFDVESYQLYLSWIQG